MAGQDREHALAVSPSLAAGTSAIILGSAGGPAAWRRNGPAVAVVCNGGVYLVDFGIGVLRQYRRAGLPHNALRAGFVTHLHSDHIAELFMYFAASHYYATDRIRLLGPASAGAGNLPPTDRDRVTAGEPAPGLRETVSRLQHAYAYDQNIRIADEGAIDIFGADGLLAIEELPNPPGGSLDDVAPPMEPVLAYEDDAVRVTAIAVCHPPIYPAWAYRFETADGSIVISGDTAPCDNIVRLAQGADILIHEVVNVDAMQGYFAQADAPDDLLRHMYKAHTSDRTLTIGDTVFEGVGSIAQRAGVGELVLTHLVPAADWNAADGWTELSDAQWLAGPQAEFDGPVHVARELDVIRVPRPSDLAS